MAAILLAITAYIGHKPTDVIAALAVWLSFNHMSVAERMRERQAIQPVVDVKCYKNLTYYLVSKEILWVLFFFTTQAYPALLGCGLFLLYPVWRKFWRSKHPIS